MDEYEPCGCENDDVDTLWLINQEWNCKLCTAMTLWSPTMEFAEAFISQ